jgi:hypothetical protein
VGCVLVVMPARWRVPEAGEAQADLRRVGAEQSSDIFFMMGLAEHSSG